MSMKYYFFKSLAAKVLIACLTLSVGCQNEKSEVRKAIHETSKAVEKGATVVGNKTTEVAVKGGAKIIDKTFKNRIAPDGSDVYIDNLNRKYYVTKKGAKIYLKSTQIRIRPKSE